VQDGAPGTGNQAPHQRCSCGLRQPDLPVGAPISPRRNIRGAPASPAKEIIRYRELLNDLVAKHTGQPLEKVTKDTDRDFILTRRAGRGVRSRRRGHHEPENPTRVCGGGRKRLVTEPPAEASL
jgi:hypothetical protein